MKLNEAQTELLRERILEVLEANPSTYGLPVQEMRVHLVGLGFDLPSDVVAAELRYLLDKEFVAAVPKTLNPKNTAWRITATGRDAMRADE